jgi:hypothetical protein
LALTSPPLALKVSLQGSPDSMAEPTSWLDLAEVVHCDHPASLKPSPPHLLNGEHAYRVREGRREEESQQDRNDELERICKGHEFEPPQAAQQDPAPNAQEKRNQNSDSQNKVWQGHGQELLRW